MNMKQAFFERLLKDYKLDKLTLDDTITLGKRKIGLTVVRGEREAHAIFPSFQLAAMNLPFETWISLEVEGCARQLKRLEHEAVVETSLAFREAIRAADAGGSVSWAAWDAALAAWKRACDDAAR